MRRKKEGQIFENIEVVDAGSKGKSVAKAPDGRVIFLSNAIPGDTVDIQTTKKRKSYFEGVAVKFRSLSEKRVVPVCIHFGVCGGCKWQHMGYEYQLYYKQREIENNLRRLGHLVLPEISTILPSEKQYFYRNKMEFSFSSNRWLSPEEIASDRDIHQKNALGLHIPGMWDKILDLKECHLQENPSNVIRLAVKEFAVRHKLSFFNPKTQEGLLRTFMIRISSTSDIMVLVQFYEENYTLRVLLLDFIKEQFPEITSLLYVVNQKQNDTIYDQDVICYHGQDYINETMEGLRFKINAKSFYQTNSDQAYELYKVVRDFAELTGKEMVYDLYTGAGTIALFLAKDAATVVGIEAVPEAIQDAKVNAVLNGIDNVEFVAGDMKTIFNEGFIALHGVPDVLITDPPRDGMHKLVVEQILKTKPKKVVYVSCNSATQARDLALLKEDYTIAKVQPVDMFPQTYHVENVVLLEKR